MYVIPQFADMTEFHLWAINQMYERYKQQQIFASQPNPPVAMHNQATAAPSAQGKPMSLNDVIKGMQGADAESIYRPDGLIRGSVIAELSDANAHIKKLEAENRELSKKLADIDRVLGVGRND
jgi:hypothetical protein